MVDWEHVIRHCLLCRSFVLFITMPFIGVARVSYGHLERWLFRDAEESAMISFDPLNGIRGVSLVRFGSDPFNGYTRSESDHIRREPVQP